LKIKSLYSAVLLAALAVAAPAIRAHAQDTGPEQTLKSHPDSKRPEHMDEQASRHEEDEFRHSSAVQAIARFGHMDVETAAMVFEDFNSGVLILAILAFLLKILPKTFRKRSETLQKDLVDARSASQEAGARLSEVEKRLANLDDEIKAIREQTERDSVEDEKRIRAVLEAERERIVASAGQDIEAAQATAQRELKKFAADLAIDRAARSIHLSPEADRLLIRGTGESLADLHTASRGKGEQN
jgi:F-type H+-transporting ATPase subunit b